MSPPPAKTRLRLPDAFIGGAQKAGTTSLHAGLATHPEIYFPPEPQEIHFFDRDEEHARGLEHYGVAFAGHRGQAVVAQTSPLYLYLEEVPGRIAEDLPNAKFLFILKNPVDRAESHYWHEVRYGWEDSPTFEEALDKEEERLARGTFNDRRHYSYLDRGRYAAQIERYFDAFSKEQVHLMLQDDLKEDAEGLLRGAARFLGLDENLPGWVPDTTRRNVARVCRWRRLQGWTRPLREVWKGGAAAVDALNLKRERPPKMAPDLRRELLEQMRPEIVKLQQLTGLPVVEKWLGGGAPTSRPKAPGPAAAPGAPP